VIFLYFNFIVAYFWSNPPIFYVIEPLWTASQWLFYCLGNPNFKSTYFYSQMRDCNVVNFGYILWKFKWNILSFKISSFCLTIFPLYLFVTYYQYLWYERTSIILQFGKVGSRRTPLSNSLFLLFLIVSHWNF
jgi:hypothetical protein